MVHLSQDIHMFGGEAVFHFVHFCSKHLQILMTKTYSSYYNTRLIITNYTTKTVKN